MNAILKFTTMLLVLAGSFASCEEKELQSDLISNNLLKKGSANPALLIGKWNCVKFAHTTDGSSISEVGSLSKGTLEIPIVSTPSESSSSDNRWCFTHLNQSFYNCSLSGNLITLTQSGSTFAAVSPEEADLTTALSNAYSFVVTNDGELIFYFKESETKNLLILNKQ